MPKYKGGKVNENLPPPLPHRDVFEAQQGREAMRTLRRLARERAAHERRMREIDASITGKKRKRGGATKVTTRYVAKAPSQMPTQNGEVRATTYNGDKETSSTILKSHIPELLKEYEKNPDEYNQQQLINLLTRLGEVEERQKKDELIKEITHNGQYGKKTVFADIFHSQGTSMPGQDLESLSVEQLENIKTGREETKRNSEKPWYEKAKDVLQSAVVPALGDVAHIFGQVIPGLSLVTDEIEKVTNHGVHSWDDLGPLGDLINVAPGVAGQLIPAHLVTDALEAAKAAKALGTDSSQLDEEHGGRINPYKRHHRSYQRVHRY